MKLALCFLWQTRFGFELATAGVFSFGIPRCPLRYSEGILRSKTLSGIGFTIIVCVLKILLENAGNLLALFRKTDLLARAVGFAPNMQGCLGGFFRQNVSQVLNSFRKGAAMSWKISSALLMAISLMGAQRSEAGFIYSQSTTTATAQQGVPSNSDTQQATTTTTATVTATVDQASATSSATNTSSSLGWTFIQSYNTPAVTTTDVSLTAIFQPDTSSSFVLTTSLNYGGTPTFSNFTGTLYDNTTQSFVISSLSPNQTYTGTLQAGHEYTLFEQNIVLGVGGTSLGVGSMLLTAQSVVPEPASLSLLLSGAPILGSIGWWSLSRRRRQQAAV